MKKLLPLFGLLMSLQLFSMQIFVVMPSEKTIALEVESNDTIEFVKGEIYKMEGLAPETFILTFNGIELEDGYTLAYYNIQKNSTLYVVLKSELSTTDVYKDTGLWFSNAKDVLILKDETANNGALLIYDLSGRLLEQITINKNQKEYPIKSKGSLIVNWVSQNQKSKSLKIVND